MGVRTLGSGVGCRASPHGGFFVIAIVRVRKVETGEISVVQRVIILLLPKKPVTLKP